MRRSGIFVLLVLLLSAPLMASNRIDRPHQVVDPGYGAILFDYYQQNWFAAMSQALMALETGTLPTQAPQAQVLLGALYAHYGMPDEAEALFRKLLAESVDPALAPSIWLHLAELHYRKQRYTDALALLDEQIGTPPEQLNRQFHALRTRLLMRMGRFEETGDALDYLNEDSLSAYLRYNLAVSRINSGDGDRGEGLLWQVANLPPGDDETNALKDRAMLALGVHYLRTGQTRQARKVLRAARLDGPYSETALLLHGRAWIASDEPARALGSLQTLAERSLQFEETQEALLSLPWLFQVLGDFGRAATGYRYAISRYTEHYRYLAELEQQIRSGQWFADLVQEPVWSTAMEGLPPFKPGRVESFATFRHLFASHDFHSRWRDYHEQLRQIHLLHSWRQRLPAIEEMVAAQVRKHREQVPLAEDMLAALEQAGWPQQLKKMEQRFKHGQQSNDLSMFASEDERKLLAAVDEVETLMSRWPEKIKPELRERLALQKGLLLWQLQENSVPRQWQRESQLKELDTLLKETAVLSDRVSSAASGDSHRVVSLGHQLAGLYNEIGELEGRGDKLLGRQQQQIELLAMTQIETTRQRLKAFTAESWAALGDLQNLMVREKRSR
ncbi:lipopolysaccharide assembly protein LapB [Alcanivorax sp. 1008]|uniref:tetratricopeptide repeat protein n=1 Tax=Alcanivorax sp. 1008 TaxID=2816853 RepID=UPI001DA952A3|nr:tetratricopeptide repeat protein [Alcanivorax sp. 1008]MCC1496682.1 hypothetical protein [Alcanivorax sp. 1008]